MSGNLAPRCRLFWPFAFALVLLLTGLMLPFLRRPPLTRNPAQFDQIRMGMSEKEVEELLGGPRGIYDNTKYHSHKTPIGGHWSWGHSSTWYFPDCAIEVVFRDGKVHRK